MACLTSDGTLTGAALDLLDLLAEPLPPEAIANRLDRPLFQVRASVRELAEAGLLESRGEAWVTTEAGRARAGD